ncbi:MAG: efflux RND transporter periplasmic adaptor subunit [Treponema sp.]|nr:efflux RND transporter periplasmic adaptor subunit [Treponema sp.]
MKNFILIILQLFILLFFSCERQQKNFDNSAAVVRGIPAIERAIPDETTGFGSLSFLSKVDITSPQEAVISRLNFREGDFVNQGDVILLLDNPQINLAVERARNNYSQALAASNLASSRLLEGRFAAEAQILALEKAYIELDLAKRRWEENNRKHQNQETLFLAGGIHAEAILTSRFSIETEWEQIQLMEKELEIRLIGRRDQDLARAGISVPLNETEKKEAVIKLLTATLRAELEAAQARLEAAEKELASAALALEGLTVISPASGIVGVRFLEEGERVRPQDKIVSLIDTSSLYAIFSVRERDALRIERDMKATVLIDGTGETRKGIVDLVYPQADSQSLSFFVRVLLENTNTEDFNRLKPGMFTRVTVILGPPQNTIFVPESSIFNQKNNEASIFIINGSILTERRITLGFSYGEEREVKSGLNTGEIVVLRPDTNLREGTNVTLAN